MPIEFYVRKDTNTLIVATEDVVCDLNMLDTIVVSAREHIGAALFATKMTASVTAQPRNFPIASQDATLDELIERDLVTKLDKFDDIVNVEI
jgi:hypothetical protein